MTGYARDSGREGDATTGTRLAELSIPARGTRPVMDEEPV